MLGRSHAVGSEGLATYNVCGGNKWVKDAVLSRHALHEESDTTSIQLSTHYSWMWSVRFVIVQ